MVNIIIALTAAVIALGAELIHNARSKRVQSLAFSGSKPATWTYAVAPLRAIAIGLVCWGLVNLLQFRADKAGEDIKIDTEKNIKHLLIILDVSPSMWIVDAGEVKQKRSQRAIEITQSVMKRISTPDVHYSLVSVFTDAWPMVVDCSDRQVITNLMDMPLDHLFEPGKTQLAKGIKKSFELMEKQNWEEESTTILMISDGDTIPEKDLPAKPKALNDFIVAGIGSPTGEFIDGHTSRQDTVSLRRLATRYSGTYQNNNTKHVSTTSLGSLTNKVQKDNKELGLKELSLIATAIGALILALLPLCLCFWGKPRQSQLTLNAEANSSKTIGEER